MPVEETDRGYREPQEHRRAAGALRGGTVTNGRVPAGLGKGEDRKAPWRRWCLLSGGGRKSECSGQRRHWSLGLGSWRGSWGGEQSEGILW